MASKFSIKTRILILGSYVLALAGFSQQLFGETNPVESRLFLVFLTYLFVNLIAQPHFTSLKDSMSNAISAIIVTFPLIFEREEIQINSLSLWIWRITLLISISVVCLTVLIAWLDGTGKRSKQRELLFSLSSRLGSPKVLFTILYFLILYSFYSTPHDIFRLSFAWIAITFGQLVEYFVHYARHFHEVLLHLKDKPQEIGEVISRDHPHLLTIRIHGEEQSSNRFASFGSDFQITISSLDCS